MTKHGLGRLYKPDVRDHNFLLDKATKRSSVVSKVWAVADPVLDQGQTPMCVGYGTAKWVEAAPIVNTLPDPVKLYHEAQQYDDTPGDNYEGTTVRGAMKALKVDGLVSSYSWAFDINTVINYVLEKGPMVAGTNWYNNMFDPDVNGNLSVSGSLAGGHCYVLIGADQSHKNRSGKAGALMILNSWGDSWGLHGRAWMSFSSFNKLLTQQGEVAVANEIQK